MEKIQERLAQTSGFIKSMFPINRYVQEANELIEDCLGRHDVPQGEHIPADLRDTKGDGLVNANGFPVAGIIAQEDYHFGGPSPVIPIFIGGWGMVLGLHTLLGNLHLPAIALCLVAVYTLISYRIAGLGVTIAILLLSFFSSALNVLSLFAPAAVQPLQIMFSGGGWLSMLGKLLPLLVPYCYYRIVQNRYVKGLAEMGSIFNGAIIHQLRRDEEARTKQAAAAILDDTWFNQVGTATEAFAQHGDSFAPDYGLPFGQTIQDQRQHGFLFGASGTGKTTTLKNIMAGVLKQETFAELIANTEQSQPLQDVRATVEQIFADRVASTSLTKNFARVLQNYRNGMLVLDGKGPLPWEVQKLLDLVINPKTVQSFNYMEGVKPEVFAKVILNIFGGQAKDPTWNNAGYSHLYYGMVFHQALIRLRGASKSPIAHIRTIMELGKHVEEGKDGKLHHPVIDQFAEEPELTTPGTILNDAMNKFISFNALADETKSSVIFTVENWLLKFIQSEELRPWADSEESDFTFSDILYGAKFGIALPEYQFGEAGLAIQSLMKARLYNEIKNRGNDALKQGKGYSRVFLFVDECQRFLDDMDLAILPEARSLELVCWFASQNIDSVFERYNRDGGEKFMASFASLISFKSSPATYSYIQNRIGKARVIVKNDNAKLFDFGSNAALQMGTPFFDTANPHRSRMKRFTFGLSSVFFQDGYTANRLVEGKDKNGNEKFGGSNLVSWISKSVQGGKFAFSREVTMTLSKEPEFIFQDRDIQALETPFRAVATVMRGGVVRRDIIKTIPYTNNFTEIDTSIETARNVIKQAQKKHENIEIA